MQQEVRQQSELLRRPLKQPPIRLNRPQRFEVSQQALLAFEQPFELQALLAGAHGAAQGTWRVTVRGTILQQVTVSS